MKLPKMDGRGWANVGFWFGILASIAANVAHAFVPPDGLPWYVERDYSPSWIAVAISALWPSALVIAVEALSRTSWPRGLHWKIFPLVGTAVVAGAAAFISYKHLRSLILYYGEDPWSASVGPLAIDGLMILCSAARLATSPKRMEAVARAKQEKPQVRAASKAPPRAELAAKSPDFPSIPGIVPPPKRRGRAPDPRAGNAVVRVRAGESAAEVARDLRVSRRTVENWVAKATREIRLPDLTTNDHVNGSTPSEVSTA